MEFVDPRLLAERPVFRVFVQVLLAEAVVAFSWNVRVNDGPWLMQAIYLFVAGAFAFEWGIQSMQQWTDWRRYRTSATPPYVNLGDALVHSNYLLPLMWLSTVANSGVAGITFWLDSWIALNLAIFMAWIGVCSANPKLKLKRSY